MRWIWGCLLGLVVVLWSATPVAACSLAVPTLDGLAQQADLIVVATVTQSEGNHALFMVDTLIKGNIASEPFSVLDHTIDYDAMCKPILGLGNRFAEGSTWVLFLGPNQFDGPAVWQPISFGNAGSLDVDEDQVRYFEQNQEIRQPLADLISTLTNYSLAGGPTVTVLPVDQTAEPKAPPSMPTATPEPVLQVDQPQATEQASVLPWVLVGIAVLAGVGALIGWRRSQ
ncbi:hypothetical protein [Herpetosiphon llansteffanensis]|uniref:hypothetical protein n=1 Tax=Herpetosiphon llansteffanensis TaxID=2094568 RepID=UPI000D7D11E5|nr:hypothetical protein [Herpetosiphon llansteffanensis]